MATTYCMYTQKTHTQVRTDQLKRVDFCPVSTQMIDPITGEKPICIPIRVLGSTNPNIVSTLISSLPLFVVSAKICVVGVERFFGAGGNIRSPNWGLSTPALEAPHGLFNGHP